jgi:hypothetical protein
MSNREYDILFIDELSTVHIGENIRTLGIFEKYDQQTKRALMSWKQEDILHVNLDSVCLDMDQQHIYFILGDVVNSEESLPGKLGGIYIRARHVICADGIDISLFQTSVFERRKLF